MYSDYLTWKEKYPNSVVLIKSGSFYRTYDNDAIVLSYLCCYKVIKNVLGFPIRSLSKILKELKREEVNFVADNEVLEKIPNIERETYHELVSLSYGLLNSKNILEDIKRINFLANFLVQKRMISYNLYIEFGERINNIIMFLKSSMKV